MKHRVLDIENVGDPFFGRLLCVGWGDKAYAPLAPGWHDMLAELADDSIAKVVFTKHDHRWLRLAGFDVRGPIIDVQTMAWAVNERTPLDLEWCANHYAGIIMDKRIHQRGGSLWFTCDNGDVVPLGEEPLEQMLAYNERDLEATQRLMLELKRRLMFDDLAEYYEHDALPFTPVLLDMEVRGIPVDVDAAKILRSRLKSEIEALEDWLYVTGKLPADFNLGSNKQLAAFLFGKSFQHKRSVRITTEQRTQLKARHETTGTYGTLDGLIVERVGRDYAHGYLEVTGLGLKNIGVTETGQPATNAKDLQVAHGDNPWVAKYLELASKKTIVNVFLTTIEEQSHNGRLYGRFNQTGTKTGRLSSSSPNLQNIPSRGPLGRQVRELFRPEPGWQFIHGDYGQLEPRLMAHFSGDPVLRDVYQRGEDIYLATGAQIFGCSLEEARRYRNAMKVYILALGYGSGSKTLRAQLAQFGQFFPLHEVEDTLAGLKRVYSVFFEWKEDVIFTAQNEGFVESLSGHRRRFTPGGKRNWRNQGSDERQAVNAVIQGSAADIVARAMMKVDAMPGLELVVQVHDEMLIQAPASLNVDLPAIQSACEVGHGFDLAVPLVFEPRVIPTWAEGKD